MEIEIGKRVVASTGKHIGNVDHIVLNSETQEFLLFIVREGLILTKDRMIDPSFVESVDADGTVHLNVDENRIDELPEFVHAKFAPSIPEDDWMKLTKAYTPTILMAPAEFAYANRPSGLEGDSADGIDPSEVSNLPPNAAVIDRRSKVFDHEGNEIGSVEDVAYQDDGTLVSIEVRAGHLEHHIYTVVAADVASISQMRVVLKISKEEAEKG